MSVSYSIRVDILEVLGITNDFPTYLVHSVARVNTHKRQNLTYTFWDENSKRHTPMQLLELGYAFGLASYF